MKLMRLKKSLILYYKISMIIFFVSLGSHQMYAQHSQTVFDEEDKMGRAMSIQFSLLRPIAFGDNFANKALSQKVGYQTTIRFYFLKHFFLGAEGGSFSADVKDKESVGDYDRSNANTYGITGGYSFSFNESHNVDVALALGSANYRNKKNDLADRFVDRGSYVKLQLQYNYNFNKHFSIYALAGLRYDHLDIDSSPLIDDFINKAQYLTFGFGIKYNLITYKSIVW